MVDALDDSWEDWTIESIETISSERDSLREKLAQAELVKKNLKEAVLGFFEGQYPLTRKPIQDGLLELFKKFD
jgi:hypothetical protein